MKFTRTHYIIFAVLLLLLVVWNLAEGSYVPYNSQSLFRNQTEFEGFEGKPKEETVNSPRTPPRPQRGMGSARTGRHDSHPRSFFQKVKHETKENIQHLGKLLKTDDKKKEGFSDYQSATEPPKKMIDVFSGLTGSKTCKPSGFSNEQGFLCLTEEAIQMLTTRGGNAH
jgi:hypothetical protein